ncbi:MAG TPA: sigma-70 family RNA polymerase sigma factor [Acidimicrobiales bacterium]|nr:sigma-70 family RNA polymerase sigma factor [Acidimicrobiales bacterium]
MNEDLRAVSDATLVVAIARYREDALAEAYRRHAGVVFGLARRLLSDAAIAEEIVQEVFLRLWNGPDRFDPDRGSLRSLLLSWTHGLAVDALRSDSARRRREERDAQRAATRGRDIEDEVVDLTTAARVQQALRSLRPEERTAIELAYYRGLTYREVATHLQEPEGTVKSRIRSGLRSMRRSLSPLGAGGEP